MSAGGFVVASGPPAFNFKAAEEPATFELGDDVGGDTAGVVCASGLAMHVPPPYRCRQSVHHRTRLPRAVANGAPAPRPAVPVPFTNSAAVPAPRPATAAVAAAGATSSVEAGRRKVGWFNRRASKYSHRALHSAVAALTSHPPPQY